MNRPLAHLLLLACCILMPARAGAQYVYIPEDIHFQSPHVPEFIEFAGETTKEFTAAFNEHPIPRLTSEQVVELLG